MRCADAVTNGLHAVCAGIANDLEETCEETERGLLPIFGSEQRKTGRVTSSSGSSPRGPQPWLGGGGGGEDGSKTSEG